jgi:hypothetical protein
MRRSLHRSIALLAAYALALQAVLAAFAIAAPLARDEGFSICRGDGAGTPGAPTAHDQCGACLAGHCAASDAPARVALAARWPAVVRITQTLPRAAPLNAAATTLRAHAPRAPPAG